MDGGRAHTFSESVGYVWKELEESRGNGKDKVLGTDPNACTEALHEARKEGYKAGTCIDHCQSLRRPRLFLTSLPFLSPFYFPESTQEAEPRDL